MRDLRPGGDAEGVVFLEWRSVGTALALTSGRTGHLPSKRWPLTNEDVRDDSSVRMQDGWNQDVFLVICMTAEDLPQHLCLI